MADRHVGDLAELYALGALDEREAAFVETHIEECDECMRFVGEAEETVLALERGFTQQHASLRPLFFHRRTIASFLQFAGATAAGLVLGIGLMVPQFRANQQSQAAVDAMIHSHFAHAPFAAVTNDAPAGKVIYAHDRAWLYVVVSGQYAYEVDAVNGGVRRSLGTLRSDGDVSTLFVRAPGPSTEVDLADGARVLERAKL